MSKHLILFVLALASISNLNAQGFYDSASISVIEIDFSQSNWDYMLDTAKAGSESYIMSQSVTINGTYYDSVGVKYKGNSTYKSNQVKNPWHIELDTYKNQHYQGFTDIKLSNVAKDPSFLREVLSYEIARKYMFAPLANYAVVYVNGNQIGLYSSAESINKSFVDNYLRSRKGAFIKCNPPAGAGPGTSSYPDLVYNGNDSTNYYDSYEIKSNAGWAELIHLMDTLANDINAIEEILQVDQTLWMHAFNNVLVNLDSYAGGFKQNYYLYRMKNRQFYPVIWDMNESFGKFSMTGTINLGNTTSKAQMTHLLHSNDAAWPLIQKLLSIPMYKRMYLAHMKTILDENFSNGTYFNKAQFYHNLIDSAVSADPNKLSTYTQFKSNITTDVGGGGGGPGGGSSAPGISALMNARASYLQSRPDLSATQPTITNIVASAPSAAPSTGTITANVTNATFVYLSTRNDLEDRFERQQMYDDGIHGDGAANDGVFGAFTTVTSVQQHFYIYADAGTIGKFSPERAGHEYHVLGFQNPTSGLVINEFMASNSSTVSAADGGYYDWIELHNASNSPIFLGDYGLSDNLNDPEKYILPSVNLPSGGFMLIWASNEAVNNPYHAPFKLAKSGEEIALFHDPLGSADTVDYINFGAQSTDVSFGRSYDASPNWIDFLIPTPDASNTPLQLDEPAMEALAVYPNPHNGQFELVNKYSETIFVNAYDLKGVLVFSKRLNRGDIESINFNGSLILHYVGQNSIGSKRILFIQ
ncbi:MAG: hypothetical protein CMP53_00160 [Flavobacteriales bacterium]|nr:hypothetical protein [Flavobacteriales bacterium]